MRPSEIRALTWSKIDLNRKTVLIDQAIVKTNKNGYITKNTKTNDIRINELSSYLIALLEAILEKIKMDTS